MPLITMTGFPSSGKTRRANEILAYFRTRMAAEEEGGYGEEKIGSAGGRTNFAVHVIDDALLGISKSAYAVVADEKKARSAILAAVERYLSADSLVILDSLNYIKGLRYQIYCTARLVKSTFCVVHAAVPAEYAAEWNRARGPDGYDPKTFDELVSRYEEPDGRNRWDSPLFTILHDDADLSYEAIWDSVMLSKAKPSLKSTTQPVVKETNYLYLLESTTQAIVDALLAAQKDSGPVGGNVVVPGTDRKLLLPPRTLTLSELRRLRRQFTQLNRQQGGHLLEDRIADNFVQYLSTTL